MEVSRTAAAAAAARRRAAECQLRVARLADRQHVTSEDVRAAHAALERAQERAATARYRLVAAQLRLWAVRPVAAHASSRGARLGQPRDVATLPQPPDAATLREQARLLDGGELFVTYLALGGACSPFELDAFVHAALELPPIERAILGQAIWEMTGL